MSSVCCPSSGHPLHLSLLHPTLTSHALLSLVQSSIYPPGCLHRPLLSHILYRLSPPIHLFLSPSTSFISYILFCQSPYHPSSDLVTHSLIPPSTYPSVHLSPLSPSPSFIPYSLPLSASQASIHPFIIPYVPSLTLHLIQCQSFNHPSIHFTVPPSPSISLSGNLASPIPSL